MCVQTFQFRGELKDISATPLQLHCWDYDTIGRDDKLGHASVDLRGLMHGERREYNVALSEGGVVFLSAWFVADGHQAPAFDNTPSGAGAMTQHSVSVPSSARRGVSFSPSANVSFANTSTYGRGVYPPAWGPCSRQLSRSQSS